MYEVPLSSAITHLPAIHEDDDVVAQRPLFIQHVAACLWVSGEVLIEGFPHGCPGDGF